MFVEYLSYMFDLVACFESPGQQSVSPFKNYINKYLTRIPFIKKCYKSLEENDVMTHCWFLCHSFKPTRLSKFFEGEIDLYKNAYIYLYSFSRKFFHVDDLN